MRRLGSSVRGLSAGHFEGEALDDGVREELLAHLANTPLRFAGVRGVETDLHVLACANVGDRAEPERSERLGDGQSLRIVHGRFERDRDGGGELRHREIALAYLLVVLAALELPLRGVELVVGVVMMSDELALETGVVVAAVDVVPVAELDAATGTVLVPLNGVGAGAAVLLLRSAPCGARRLITNAPIPIAPRLHKKMRLRRRRVLVRVRRSSRISDLVIPRRWTGRVVATRRCSSGMFCFFEKLNLGTWGYRTFLRLVGPDL